jgi:hypothetical protein
MELLDCTMTDGTTNSGSCLGDHGNKGIRSFIQGHRCNVICQELNLCSREDLLRTLDHFVLFPEEAKETSSTGDEDEQDMEYQDNRPSRRMANQSKVHMTHSTTEKSKKGYEESTEDTTSDGQDGYVDAIESPIDTT